MHGMSFDEVGGRWFKKITYEGRGCEDAGGGFWHTYALCKAREYCVVNGP